MPCYVATDTRFLMPLSSMYWLMSQSRNMPIVLYGFDLCLYYKEHVVLKTESSLVTECKCVKDCLMWRHLEVSDGER